MDASTSFLGNKNCRGKFLRQFFIWQAFPSGDAHASAIYAIDLTESIEITAISGLKFKDEKVT